MRDKFYSQPIKEGLMLGLCPFVPKIKDARNERFTKMPIPNMIDRHACSQWILRIGDPFRKCHSTT